MSSRMARAMSTAATTSTAVTIAVSNQRRAIASVSRAGGRRATFPHQRRPPLPTSRPIWRWRTRSADSADVLTMSRFRARDLVVETKPDLTPVTEADRAVEEMVRARLGRERPGDGILGEELGTTGGGRRRWIIDPIDGTKGYARGIPGLGHAPRPGGRRRAGRRRGVGARAGVRSYKSHLPSMWPKKPPVLQFSTHGLRKIQ